MLPSISPTWDLSDMTDATALRGKALYDALMRLKPENLVETDWATSAGVNRGFFSNLKAKENSPRCDTLSKLLRHIGKTEADLDEGVIPPSNARVVRFEGASDVHLPRDVPVFGTSLGAPLEFDGEAIEQTMLNTGNTIAYLPRPTVLNGQKYAYGLYVQGSSMAPRFEDGETIFVTDCRHSKPPKIGDDVVVYIRDCEDDDGERAVGVLVKRLVRRTANYVELEQFTPAVTFQIEASKILRMDRVIPWMELLS